MPPPEFTRPYLPLFSAKHKPGAGAVCQDGFDCATAMCLGRVCSGSCESGGQTQCDALFGGAGLSYCAVDLLADDLCIPSCSPSGTLLWDSADCAELFGPTSTCSGVTNRCTF